LRERMEGRGREKGRGKINKGREKQGKIGKSGKNKQWKEREEER
jgi:hypothetical protein